MIARMQLHGIRRFGLAPLNERGQSAVEQTFAIWAYRNLPLQQAFWRLTAGVNDGSAINALCFPGMSRILDALGVGHKVNEPGRFDQLSLKRFVV